MRWKQRYRLQQFKIQKPHNIQKIRILLKLSRLLRGLRLYPQLIDRRSITRYGQLCGPRKCQQFKIRRQRRTAIVRRHFPNLILRELQRRARRKPCPRWVQRPPSRALPTPELQARHLWSPPPRRTAQRNRPTAARGICRCGTSRSRRRTSKSMSKQRKRSVNEQCFSFLNRLQSNSCRFLLSLRCGSCRGYCPIYFCHANYVELGGIKYADNAKVGCHPQSTDR